MCKGLVKKKKEFMIYESTFSDILGIMLFYFLLSLADSGQVSKATTGFIGNLALTIVVSLVAGYALIYLFQHIRAHIKLFLLIAILLLLYSLAKLMHLSALIIILMFGLMLSNRHIFFKGFLKKLIHTERVEEMEDDFKLVTAESAFLIRTFFFVVFGITIVLSSLIDLKVWLISILVILAIFVLRFILVRLALGKNYMPELFLAPRGLITILLFFGIPAELQVGSFNSGILLFLIIATSIIMTAGLISSGKKKKE
ncbi:MAG TPA: sodium:proton exchanger, partial [Chromatiaceae bacterium]|nr:sodium:proton exchanger [Chromatiaceae bacterium]